MLCLQSVGDMHLAKVGGVHLGFWGYCIKTGKARYGRLLLSVMAKARLGIAEQERVSLYRVLGGAVVEPFGRGLGAEKAVFAFQHS